MGNISSKDFESLYASLLLKKDYERRLDEYYARPWYGRLLSARPRDPMEGVPGHQIVNSLQDVFHEAFGPLGHHYAPFCGRPDGLESTTLVGVDEGGHLTLTLRVDDNVGHWRSETHFEYEPGYGFVPGYQRTGDPEKDAKNRAYAYSQMEDGRLKGNYPDSVYAFFDRFRTSDFAVGLEKRVGDLCRQGTAEQVSRTASAAMDALREVDSIAVRKGKAKELREYVCERRNGVIFLKDYVFAKLTLRSIEERAAREPGWFDDPMHQAEYLGVRDALSKVSPDRLFRDGQMHSSPHSRPELEENELFKLAFDETMLLSPPGRGMDARDFYTRFARFAFSAGWKAERIHEAVLRDSADRGIAVDFKLDYGRLREDAVRDFAQRMDDFVSRREVFDYDDFDFEWRCLHDGGVVTGSLPHPYDMVTEARERRDALMECRNFLISLGPGEDPGVRRPAADIGRAMAEQGMASSLCSRMESFLGLPSGSVRKAYDIRFADDVITACGNGAFDPLEVKGADGVSIVRENVRNVITYLSRNGVGGTDERTKLLLVEFLCRMGISPDGPGCDEILGGVARKEFNCVDGAVSRLYGNGTVSDLRNVEKLGLKGDFQKIVEAGRKMTLERRRAGAAVAQERAATKQREPGRGPKL